jgi:sugar (pentulose or hexulose) kinase
LYAEYDPAEVIAAVHTLLDKLLPLADGCAGIVLTSQMHSTIFTTPRGEAQSTLTIWQDQRALLPHPSGEGSYIDVLRQRLSPDELRQLGNELRVGLPIAYLLWYVESGQPLPDHDVIVASLPDFVVAHLCDCPPVTEVTNAAAHCLLNLETLDWHHQVIEKLGLQDFHLPEIKPHGTVVGTLEWNGRNIPIYTPVGDHQCALVGSLLRENELSLNISTGSQASLLARTLVFGNFQTRAYFDGQFVRTITNIPAGRALNALVTLLSELAVAQGIKLDDPWEYIIRAAEAVGPTPLQTHLAFFNTSIGDTGSISNIHESRLTVGHLFRAAFQNMADNYYECAVRLSPEKEWNRLVFSGGLPQKIDLLRQLITERFEIPYRMSPHPEDTLLGLLVLAIAFTGRAGSVEEASDKVRAALH